jgi:hypothetical protein
MFLSRWNPANQPPMESLNEAYLAARQNPSGDSIERLKNAYRMAFPDMAADQQSRLATAKSAAAVASLFYSGLGRGTYVRFKVKTLCKRESGDDDASSKGKPDDSADTLEVWTPFGDCGYDFQAEKPTWSTPITTRVRPIRSPPTSARAPAGSPRPAKTSPTFSFSRIDPRPAAWKDSPPPTGSIA